MLTDLLFDLSTEDEGNKKPAIEGYLIIIIYMNSKKK